MSTAFKPDSKKNLHEFLEEYMRYALSHAELWRKYLVARWHWHQQSTPENWRKAVEAYNEVPKGAIDLF